jgi:hypothetical protein
MFHFAKQIFEDIPRDFHFPWKKNLFEKNIFENFSISKNNIICFEATKILQYCNLLNQIQNTFALE